MREPRPDRPVSKWVVCCAAALSMLAARAAGAQPARPPLSPGDFNIDLVIGPVLGSGRVIGLGGAYTALATGIEGASWNPASYAARAYWEPDWFEWDPAFDFIPGTLRNTDFDNNGESGFVYDQFFFATLGLRLQFGSFGFGGLLNFQTYNIGAGNDLSLLVGNYGAGYDALDGQLVLGLSARTTGLRITDRETGDDLVGLAGTGPETGILIRPAELPFRIGLAARSAVESSPSDTLVAAGLNLPRHIRLPWEFQAGFAFQLGPRPFNRKWENPRELSRKLKRELIAQRKQRAAAQAQAEAHAQRMAMWQQTSPPGLPPMGRGTPPATGDEPHDPAWWKQERKRRQDEDRELRAQLTEWEQRQEALLRNASRRYLVLSADMIVVGPTDNGVGLESFLNQQRHTSGADPTVGFRLGVEGEPIQRWLKMRAGSYFEPSRFAGVGYRAHGTLGLDVRLFSWDLFGLVDEFTLRLGAFADVAQRYLNVGGGIGLWH